MTGSDAALAGLLQQASIAAPNDRIEYRDRIAAFGDPAVRAVKPWLADPRLRLFAIRVLVTAGKATSKDAAQVALREALESEFGLEIKTELANGLAELGLSVAKPARKRTTTTTARKSKQSAAPDLVVGHKYNRRELHRDGYGGNWQSGISYPQDGHYVLLFSDPTAAHEHGYRDRWVGEGRYRYFGAWDGTGDMTLTPTNEKLVSRSPHLMLLIRDGDLWRFEGWFECASYQQERTVRDGRGYNAIVFDLQRVNLAPGGN